MYAVLATRNIWAIVVEMGHQVIVRWVIANTECCTETKLLALVVAGA